MKIIIYSGITVDGQCGPQRHPVKDVEAAKQLIASGQDVVAYSNSPDFVMAIKYGCLQANIEAEFILNGISHGNNIEPVFADFNVALDLIQEIEIGIDKD